MRDPRLDRLADVLVNYSTKVRPGELVNVVAPPDAMPMIEAVFEAAYKAGGHPVWTPRSESLDEIRLALGNDEQLDYLSPLDMHRVETIQVLIALWADQNTRYTGRIDPSRQARAQAARRPYMKRFMAREAEGSMRWVGTAYPTQAAAQDAEMSLRNYEDFIFRAGLLHLPDPAAAWAAIHARQEQVCEFLNRKKELRFRVPSQDGRETDLTVNVEGSTWINCAGDANFPDGEVFAGPKGVEGVVSYTFPAVYNGREVLGVRLRFKGGRVVDASADKNEDYLLRMLDQDAGARGLGEIAIGTNYAITEFMRNTLFDEKIGGTFHAAVGAGYPKSGNSNESALHWDMVCELRPDAAGGRHGGTIEADGEVFHRDGKFTRKGWPGND